MAGITPMGDLSHELESLVLLVDTGKISADDALFDAIQASLDELARMREQVATGQGVAPARAHHRAPAGSVAAGRRPGGRSSPRSGAGARTCGCARAGACVRSVSCARAGARHACDISRAGVSFAAGADRGLRAAPTARALRVRLHRRRHGTREIERGAAARKRRRRPAPRRVRCRTLPLSRRGHHPRQRPLLKALAPASHRGLRSARSRAPRRSRGCAAASRTRRRDLPRRRRCRRGASR